MDSIITSHYNIKKLYDKGLSPLSELQLIGAHSLYKLGKEAQAVNYQRKDSKSYFVFTDGKETSRPIRSELFIIDPEKFSLSWERFINSINSEATTSNLEDLEINQVIYTAIISIAACFDIWKKGSRKTPGTHFEILLGSIIHQFIPEYTRKKFISLPKSDENVSTDIVFDNGEIGIAIPAKITTRERIVQPYAHQRILDSVFGYQRYKSVLLCVSETQRDDKNKLVNDICVPGTLKLFQEHLSKLAGLYYLDPPTRYIRDDIRELLPVNDYAYFFKSGLLELTTSKKEILEVY